MTDRERALLERLARVFPRLPATTRAWVLGLVQGIAGPPSVESRPTGPAQETRAAS